MRDSPLRLNRPLLCVVSALYTVAGVTHFLAPAAYERVVPPSLPRPLALVYLSGVAEIVLGAGVAVRRARRRSAWGLVALLVAVFPANVRVATGGIAAEMVPGRAAGVARAACGFDSRFRACWSSGRGGTRARRGVSRGVSAPYGPLPRATLPLSAQAPNARRDEGRPWPTTPASASATSGGRRTID